MDTPEYQRLLRYFFLKKITKTSLDQHLRLILTPEEIKHHNQKMIAIFVNAVNKPLVKIGCQSDIKNELPIPKKTNLIKRVTEIESSSQINQSQAKNQTQTTSKSTKPTTEPPEKDKKPSLSPKPTKTSPKNSKPTTATTPTTTSNLPKITSPKNTAKTLQKDSNSKNKISPKEPDKSKSRNNTKENETERLQIKTINLKNHLVQFPDQTHLKLVRNYQIT